MSAALLATPIDAYPVLAAIDEIVRVGDGAGRLGWDEQQERGAYAAAMEHTKTAFHLFVRHVLAHGEVTTALQVGLGGASRHRALRCFSSRVVSVDSDPHALATALGGRQAEPGADVLIAGHPTDPAVLAELATAATGCDLLLIDRDLGYHDAAACWQALAPLVRPGGLVALVDRTQEIPEARRPDGIDQLAHDLEQRFLAPRGRSMHRFGAGHSIFVYQRAAADSGAERVTWSVPARRAEWRAVEGTRDGFTLFTSADEAHAVGGSPRRYDARRRARHEPDLVLVAPDLASLRGRLEQWREVQGVCERAAAHLLAGDVAGVRGLAAATPGSTDLEEWLLAQLAAMPHSRRLLRTIGLWFCLRGEADVGAGLLGRLVDENLTDAGALQLLAQVHLLLRADAAAARRLLAAMRSKVALQQRRHDCLAAQHEHSLWGQPKLLGATRSVLWVGAGGDAASQVAARLGMSFTWLPNGNPDAVVAPRTRIEPTIVAGGDGDVTLYRDPVDGAVCLRPWSARFAAQAGGRTQQLVGKSRGTTLDSLWHRGALTDADVDVLVVDVPGEEAAILDAATAVLSAVQVICVSVHHPVVFEGGEPHQDLLRRLERLGFAYVGAEPTAVGHRAMTFLERIDRQR